MKQIKQSFLYAILAIALFATSCSKDEAINLFKGQFSKGIFVMNEGTEASLGDITFYDTDSSKVKNAIFNAVNGSPIGKWPQSFSIYNGVGYIMGGASEKVEVVDAATFKRIATIDALKNPRYFQSVSPVKAYISDWASNTLGILDIASNKITGNIKLDGAGPEVMLKKGNYVYVALVGGFGRENKVAVIDINTNKVITTIKVGDAPLGLQEGADGNVWVLCRGYFKTKSEIETVGSLGTINAANEYTEVKKFDIGSHPDRLTVSGDKKFFYFIGGYGETIYKYDVISKTQTEFLKDSKMYFYGLNYDKKNNLIFACESKSDEKWNPLPSKIHCYDLTGKEKYSFDAGYYASSVIFTE